MTGPDDDSTDGAGPQDNLAKWYWIHAGVVGGLVFLDGLIGAQGVGSGGEAAGMLLVAVLQPVPMLLVGFAARFGGRWFTPLAVALPIVLAVGCMMMLAPGAVSMPDGTVDSQFVVDLGTTQLFNLLGAVVLAIVALRLAVRDRKRQRRDTTAGRQTATNGRRHIMSRIALATLCGVAFGIFAVAVMLPMAFPDRRAALTAAFLDRFAIGFVIGVAALPWPGWATGLFFGVLLSAPSAIVTKAWAPILGLGAVGGVIIGLVVAHFAPRAIAV